MLLWIYENCLFNLTMNDSHRDVGRHRRPTALMNQINMTITLTISTR
ncbi:hypothetical Protein YC6258_05625 [Gynuella sunshinyii YC6258]|uniref:Uncharacterized protein n=1 Tax=Gynuella sunshinyii YC6258 TaxID=1445510 RepID=A0A0C5VWG3_9GAMM|nr:hypothetical Protein YC6258_05625 [Gynuella sunshinyii YC6258]